MKVLHLCSSYTQTDLYAQLIDRLSAMGAENTVFVPVSSMPQKQYGENVIVSKCFNRLDSFFYLWKQMKITRALNKSTDVSKFDLVHAHYLFTNGRAAMKIKQKYGTDYIVAVRNTDINVFFKYRINLRRIGVKILKEAKKVVVLSVSYFDKLLKYVPKRYKEEIKNKIVVLPNGINDFWFENSYFKARDLSKINIAFAGTIDKNKNVLTSLEAIKLLSEEGKEVSYHVAGKIVDKGVYSQMIKNPNVVYHGKLVKEELIDVYRSCNIYLMPSHYETFGLVYAEALSQGLPVLYTKGQGFDGQFEDGEVGYAVVSTDANDIKDKILKVIENYDKILPNIQHCLEKFKWDKIAEKYALLYDLR